MRKTGSTPWQPANESIRQLQGANPNPNSEVQALHHSIHPAAAGSRSVHQLPSTASVARGVAMNDSSVDSPSAGLLPLPPPPQHPLTLTLPASPRL